MTTYILINTAFLFFLLLLCCFLFYSNMELKKRRKRKLKVKKIDTGQLNWKIYALLIFTVLLVLSAFAAPYVFTREAVNADFNFSQTGPIGDTIGGLMNPFIALAGVVVTGLAFYIQYKANLQQRELFLLEQAATKLQLQEQIDNQNKENKIQQFESQFYEMLKLHRENVNEMQIAGYDYEEERGVLKKFEKITDGRKSFVVMKTEFEAILVAYVGTKEKKLDREGFVKCYKLFFSGLEAFKKSYPEEKLFSDLLEKVRKKHHSPDTSVIMTNEQRKHFITGAYLGFNYKPFSGHSSRLGHYFRHLYLTVKSVANSDVITDYDEKMRYLKILRAQLSNHEQIFLFYNWLSGYGDNWENEKHSFFTEYSMIHNLWYDSLLEETFINDNVNALRIKKAIYRKGNMFEID